MLRKTVKMALWLSVGVLVFASLAAAKEKINLHAAKAKTISLRTDLVLPDGQTLKAGQYQVLVNEKLDEVEFLQNAQVVVKHACKCITASKKNDTDGVVTTEQPGKLPLLQEIRFRGETRIITLPS